MWPLLLFACVDQRLAEPASSAAAWRVPSRSVTQEVTDPTWTSARTLLHAGDPNGDGHQDLWVGAGVTWQLFLGTPAGLSPAAWAALTTTAASNATAQDWDHDGTAELAVWSSSAASAWTVDATGLPQELWTATMPTAGRTSDPSASLLLDPDGDGRPSWLRWHERSYESGCGWPQPGTWRTSRTWTQWDPDLIGGWTRHNGLEISTDTTAWALRLDGDGDGLEDLAVWEEDCRDGCIDDVVGQISVTTWWGGPQGYLEADRYATAHLQPMPERDCIDRATVQNIGDIDGDGADDLYVVDDRPRLVSVRPGLRVVLSPILDQLAADTGCAASEVSVDRAGDMNGDGFGDLLLRCRSTWRVVAGSATGPGGDGMWDLQVGEGVLRHEVLDLTGDGREDLVVQAERPGGGWVLRVLPGADGDTDGDGFVAPADCQPARADSFPGAVEVPGDGVDQDCDGVDLCTIDADGDGFGGPLPGPSGSCAAIGLSAQGGDCDDADPAISPATLDLPDDDLDADCDGRWTCTAPAGIALHPAPCSVPPPAGWLDLCPLGARGNAGVEEPGNLVDEDCDGRVLCWTDPDGDGSGVAIDLLSPDLSCDHPGLASRADDCAEGDPTIGRDLPELPGNLIDEDCDGRLACLDDHDGDGWGDDHPPYVLRTTGACGEGPHDAAVGGDCDDHNADAWPGAPDVVPPGPGDTIFDRDCDGWLHCPEDLDGDGWASPDGPWALVQGPDCPPPWGNHMPDCAPLDPTVHPGLAQGANLVPAWAVRGDLIDQDCDGRLECWVDEDGDGFGRDDGETNGWSRQGPPVSAGTCSARGWASTPGDCNDGNPQVRPGVAEIVNNNRDDDCDGVLQCLSDEDGDGWVGAPFTALAGDDCYPGRREPPAGDCDEASPGVHPDQRELPHNGVDEDCDGHDAPRLSLDDIGARRVLLHSNGGTPGAAAGLLLSLVGPGAGPCPVALGGACAGLLQPRVLATASVDTNGQVVWTVPVPAGARPGARVWMQAWTPDGGTDVVEVALP